MDRVFYNKLIRDGIKNKIESKGESCEVRIITDEQEFQQELLKKIKEEADALAQVSSRREFLSEYADLMVVLDSLTESLEIAPAELKVALEENVEKKGKFNERHFLHWSEAKDYKSNESPQGISK